MRNKTKQKLSEGKAVVGTIVGLDNILTTGIMGRSGFDFMLIDTQHAAIESEGLRRIIAGLATEVEIIVRVRWNDTPLINHALDMGADGVIIPLTNTAQDVERAVAAAKYPPIGIRSWGPRVTERYGGNEKYSAVANDETMVLPQIETAKAVDNIDEILKVKGIDGIMIGPADLGLSVGYLPHEGRAQVDEMIGHILAKCKEHGVPWGMFTSTFDRAEQWLTKGGQIATVGSDISFLTDGLAQAVGEVKALLSRI